MTDDELKKLLRSTEESDTIDMKAPIEWDGGIHSAGLTKDIAAFANSRNGGIIVIGKSETDDGTFEFTGLTNQQNRSFETTKLATWINNRFAPNISVICHHHKHDDLWYVIIEIREFDDVPHICTKDFIADKTTLLRKGTIYVRTKNAESKPLQTIEEVRTLIGLSVQKKGDELLTSLTSIMKGKPLIPEAKERNPYRSELMKIKKEVKRSFEKNPPTGFWEFMFHPIDMIPDRFESESLEARILKHVVRGQFGEEFPGSYKGYKPAGWGIYNNFHGPAFALTASGLFYLKEEFREDQMPFSSQYGQSQIEAGKWFGLELCFSKIASMYSFMSRFMHEYPAGTGIEFKIVAKGLRGRSLESIRSLRLRFLDTQTIENTFEVKKVVSVDLLKTDWKTECVDSLTRILQLFPNNLFDSGSLERFVESIS